MDMRKTYKVIQVVATYKGKQISFARYPVSDFREALNALKGQEPFSEDVVEKLKKKGKAIRDFREDNGKLRFTYELQEIPLGK